MALKQDLKKALQAGAIWTDDEIGQVPPQPSQNPLSVTSLRGRAYGWRSVKGLAVSPILSKLYQESNLRDGREA